MKNVTVILLILVTMMLLIAGCSSQQQTTSGASIPTVTSQAPEDSSEAVVAAPVKQPTASAQEPVVALDSTATSTVKLITLEAFNWGFRQSGATDIRAGDAVRLTVKSSEGIHGVGIRSLNLSTEKVNPGEEATLEFTVTKAGDLEYYCNVPCGSGHREMKGKLIVSP